MNPNTERTYQETVLEILGKYKVQEGFHQKAVILLFQWKYTRPNVLYFFSFLSPLIRKNKENTNFIALIFPSHMGAFWEWLGGSKKYLAKVQLHI